MSCAGLDSRLPPSTTTSCLPHTAGDEALYQAVVARTRAACDEDTWEQASAEGRAMSLDEAAEYALS